MGCKTCPNGTYTAKVGETSATSCTFCAPGHEHEEVYFQDYSRYVVKAWEARCSPCPSNTFLSYPGANHSLKTPSDPQCAPPSFCPPASETARLQRWPSSETAGGSGEINPELPAVVVPSTRRCTACPKAKYALGGATECLPCSSSGIAVSGRTSQQDKQLFDQFDCQCDDSCVVVCTDYVCYRRQTRNFLHANTTCMLWGGRLLDYKMHPYFLMEALGLLNGSAGFYYATASPQLDELNRAWCASVFWNETIVLRNGTRVSSTSSLSKSPSESDEDNLGSENHYNALCDSFLPSLCFKCRPNHVTLRNATCVPCRREILKSNLYSTGRNSTFVQDMH